MRLLLLSTFTIVIFTSCGDETTGDIVNLFLISQAVPGETYYVDATGESDSNDCLSSDAPCKTLDFVNRASYRGGSRVLFKRGETFRGQLIPKSGTLFHDTCYGAYGSGDKPVLLGSVNMSQTSDWIDEGENIWRCATTFDTDVGNLIFDNAAGFGFKKWSQGDCTSQGDYHYRLTTGKGARF